ncbi:hypothetical protein HYALB_00001226 [Hymenoscyphus albidus]|uniref:Uncharacterized protein n=1 Tax=Hymenoscyphus albidus TaxID=595503 RepID=A0A9N9LHN9_9HELO|nr:hypothetical protein HYALB_00001226 [Hymenoscyphus albidus]
MPLSQSTQHAQKWVDSQDLERSDSTQSSRVRSRSSLSIDPFVKDETPAVKKARLRDQTQDPDELSSITVKTATTPSASAEFVWEPSEIQVGTYKECNKVAIFAKLNNATNSAVSFKINLQEADRLSNIKFAKETMKYEQVNFAPEFNRDSPAETKAYIKEKFTRVPRPHLDPLVKRSKDDDPISEKPVLAAILDQYKEASSSPGISVRDSNGSNNLTRNAISALVVEPESVQLPPSPIDSSTIRSQQRQSLTAILSGFEEHVTGEFKMNVKNAINGIDNRLNYELNKQDKLVQHYEKKCADLVEKITTQKRIIDEYERRYGDLSDPVPNSMNSYTNELARTPSSVQRNGKVLAHTSNLEMKRFELIDGNRVNGGMMTEKVARRVMYKDNLFEETVVVEELINYTAKGTFHSTTIIDGRPFTTFLQRDGTFRYLESPNPGNDGIATADGGRKFAKWTLLKPASEPEYPDGDALPV